MDMPGTITEMATLSAVGYGIPSLSGLVALSLPFWPEANKPVLYAVVTLALLLALAFYLLRQHIPLWIAVVHVPLGLSLVGISIYAGHSAAGLLIGSIYILSSIYAFHFFTLPVVAFFISFSAATFAGVAASLEISGWPAITMLLIGCCITAGIIVRMLINRIHTLATRDNLTGLLNRHTWDAFFKHKISSSERSKDSLVVMMIDLDNFKQINDQRGHLAGDRVLVEVGQALRDSARNADIIARWGGDEFILLLQNTDVSAAQRIAERLHKRLDNIIGFSIGVAQWHEHDSCDSLLYRADADLYNNKAAGMRTGNIIHLKREQKK